MKLNIRSKFSFLLPSVSIPSHLDTLSLGTVKMSHSETTKQETWRGEGVLENYIAFFYN